MAEDSGNWIENSLPPWRTMWGWRRMLIRAHQVAIAERAFPSEIAQTRTVNSITQQLVAADALQEALGVTSCPNCRDLFCHLGNRDQELREALSQIHTLRHQVSDLESVRQELSRWEVPTLSSGGQKLALAYRVRLLALRGQDPWT